MIFPHELQDFSTFFCIDGGGSKTRLQILSKQRQLLPLPGGFEKLSAPCNLSSQSTEKIKTCMKTLLEDIEIDSSQAALICACAGTETMRNFSFLEELFSSFGFHKQNCFFFSDAKVCLELLGEHGAVILAGTGSIVVGKHGNTSFHAGGLGPFLGDEGSGFFIGKQALIAALKEQGGWGTSTSLTPDLLKFFETDTLQTLLPSIHKQALPAKKIASLCPLVFEHAHQGDLVSQSILDSAAKHLSLLLSSVCKRLDLPPCPIYLCGGVFKSPYANLFIKKILHDSPSFLPLNISHKNPVIEALKEFLLRKSDPRLKNISHLPLLQHPVPKPLPCDSLETEKLHPLSKNLSQVFSEDFSKGLKILHTIDCRVVPQVRHFIKKEFVKRASQIQDTVRKKGRVFFLGAGSSGRLGIHLVSSMHEQRPDLQDSFVALLAGGPSAFIRAKEGSEDSFAEGYSELKKQSVQPQDLVILLSASASARFLMGAAKAAFETKAPCWLICNTSSLAPHTLSSVKEYCVDLSCLETGPQAITGSTRLQAASATFLFFSCLLNHFEAPSLSKALSFLKSYEKALLSIPSCFASLETLSKKAAQVLSSEGMIASLAEETSFRETLMDCSELPPTFSLHPDSFQCHLKFQKEAPLFLIAVFKSPKPTECLKRASAAIVVCESSIQKEAFPQNLVFLENVESDALHLLPSLLLKQLLNLFSNATMIAMGKVYGNIMIDVNPSNTKLLDRSIRIVEKIYKETNAHPIEMNRQVLAELLKRCQQYKEWKESLGERKELSPVRKTLRILSSP